MILEVEILCYVRFALDLWLISWTTLGLYVLSRVGWKKHSKVFPVSAPVRVVIQKTNIMFFARKLCATKAQNSSTLCGADNLSIARFLLTDSLFILSNEKVQFYFAVFINNKLGFERASTRDFLFKCHAKTAPLVVCTFATSLLCRFTLYGD